MIYICELRELQVCGSLYEAGHDHSVSHGEPQLAAQPHSPSPTAQREGKRPQEQSENISLR